jgi:hypothetical protein
MKLSYKVSGIIITTICLLSFSTASAAQMDQGARLKTGGTPPGGVHILEIAPEVYSFTYKEPDIMQEKGYMGAIGGSYAYHNDAMFKIEGRYFYGKVDYENSGKVDNIKDHGFEIRILGGYDFKVTKTLTITPSGGFGYRYLKDDMGGRISSTGAMGYSRESNYYYSPIGIEAVQVVNDRWSIGAILEYDYFWGGVQQSNLKDADSGLNNVRNDQNSGYGLRASLAVKRQTDWGYFTIEPFIRYWKIESSAEQLITQAGLPVAVGWEPNNNTTEIGLRFVIEF